MDDETKIFLKIAASVCFIIALTIGGGMAGCPIYNVWSSGLGGQAELRRAEQNRQIKIQEAHAAYESSKLLAQAEVERAKGVAQANEIIAGGLGGPEGYLRYLYIHAIAENRSNQFIYLPTEAGLPILEATRVPTQQKK